MFFKGTDEEVEIDETGFSEIVGIGTETDFSGGGKVDLVIGGILFSGTAKTVTIKVILKYPRNKKI